MKMPKTCQQSIDTQSFSPHQEISYQELEQQLLGETKSSTQINLEVTLPEKEAPESQNSEACVGIGRSDVPPILTQPSINTSHNHFLACEDPVEYKSKGHIEIPRELLIHPLVMGATPMQVLILITIIQNCHWNPYKDYVFDDQGVKVILKRGMLCASRQEIADLVKRGCTPKMVRTALDKFCDEKDESFSSVKILSRSRANQRTIITVCFPGVFDKKQVDAGRPSGRPRADRGPTNKEVRELKEVSMNDDQKTDHLARSRADAAREQHQSIAFDSKLGFTGITDQDRAEWKTAYPNIAGLEIEIAKAAQWLKARPSQKKKLIRKFLTNWLSKADEKALLRASSQGAYGANVDRRTRNKDNTPVTSPADGRF